MVRWQKFLLKRGFFKGEPQGNYGVLTERATADFQAANGLDVDGTVGSQTLKVARRVGYSDAISAKTDDSCCKGIGTTNTGERFPQTRRTTLSSNDIRATSDANLRYAINEMYARYGLTFKDPAVQTQFCQREWYRPKTTRTVEEAEGLMSQVEKSNLKALASERYRRRVARGF